MKVKTTYCEACGEYSVILVVENLSVMRLGQLQQTVDGFHGAISQLGFHVGSDAVAMALEGTRQNKEGRQARALGPSQSSL